MKNTASARIIAWLAITMLAACIVPGVAFAQDSTQLTGASATDTSALTSLAGYTGKYYTKYAVIKSDGLIYRSNSSGTSIGDVWGDNNIDASQTLDKVEILYINANVTSLDNLKHRFYSGSTLVERGVNLSGRENQTNLEGLTKIVFKLDSNSKNSVRTMPDGVFREHKQLVKVENFQLTKATNIPNYAFSGCQQLTEILLPMSTASVGNEAFYNCQALERVVFGSSSQETSIGDRAFKNCHQLGKKSGGIDLPFNLTSLGTNAFEGCQELKRVVIWNSDATVTAGSYVFRNAGVQHIYVHNRFLGYYQADDSTNKWSPYRNLIHGFLEIESVPDVTYTGNALTPSPSVTWLGDALSSTFYTVSYKNNIDAGTASITVKGVGAFAKGEGVNVTSDTKTFTIKKASQKPTVKTTVKKVRSSALKNKTVMVSPLKVTGTQGKVAYAKVSGSKKLTVNKKSGKVKVQMGTTANLYKVKVKVTASATSNYKAFSKTVTAKVRVV